MDFLRNGIKFFPKWRSTLLVLSLCVLAFFAMYFLPHPRSLSDIDSANILSNDEALRLRAEKNIEQKIQILLENTLGEGKTRTQVNLDMNFDYEDVNEEIFDPDGQVVRSTITSDEVKGEGETNYEISRTVKNKVKSGGVIKRMNVVVMVDGIYNSEGSYQERTANEMERIEILVKSIIGYDANRGDVVEVVNMRFAPDSATKSSLWYGFAKQDIVRIIEIFGMLLVSTLLILLVIKPLVSNHHHQEEKNNHAEPEDDNILISNFLSEHEEDMADLINGNKISGKVKASSLKKINEIVEKSPETTLNIIRNWLYNTDSNG